MIKIGIIQDGSELIKILEKTSVRKRKRRQKVGRNIEISFKNLKNEENKL